jgi:hypothetical protein
VGGYSTKMMMTTTTTMTSAAIAMLRVLMATSVYLVAPGASTRIWRPGQLENADPGHVRTGDPTACISDEMRRIAELQEAGVIELAPAGALARTLARFPGLAPV